jgi:GTP1/Obg family GTP-binding protein
MNSIIRGLSRNVLIILFGFLGMILVDTMHAHSSQEDLVRSNLEPFAMALKEITQIHTTYKQRIFESETPMQADSLQQEANQKMNQAVSAHGLTIEKYNTIFNTIEKDPKLKEELTTLLHQAP